MPTLFRSNRLFPSHAQIGSFNETLPIAAGTDVPLTADQYLVVPDPMHPTQFLQYSFLFWNAIGSLGSGLSVDMTMPSTDATATAWYVQTGGPGGGGAGVSTFAFSNELDQVLGETPISSVNPGSAWTGGNATGVSTTKAVQITAKNTVGGTPSGASFDQWFQFGSGTPSGPVLSVPANGSSLAIASYRIPQPLVVNWHLKDLVAALDQVIRRIDPSDPAPTDMARLVNEIKTQIAVQVGADELTQVISQLDKLDTVQLKGALADIRGKMRRLEAAQKIVNEALVEQGSKG